MLRAVEGRPRWGEAPPSRWEVSHGEVQSPMRPLGVSALRQMEAPGSFQGLWLAAVNLEEGEGEDREEEGPAGW